MKHFKPRQQVRLKKLEDINESWWELHDDMKKFLGTVVTIYTLINECPDEPLSFAYLIEEDNYEFGWDPSWFESSDRFDPYVKRMLGV